MKIYRHEIEYRTGEVKTVEFEVEEKPKTFKFIEPTYITSVRKSQMGVLDYGRMFTTTPDPHPFLLALVAKKEQSVAYYSELVNTLQKELDKAKRLLAEVETA